LLEASAIRRVNWNICRNSVEEEAAVAITKSKRTIERAITHAAGCIATNWANLSCLHVPSIRDATVASSLECSIQSRGTIALRSID